MKGKKFGIRLKFRSRLEEGIAKMAAYSALGVLVLFFVFKVAVPFAYVELFIATAILLYIRQEDVLNYLYGGAILAFIFYSVIGVVLSTNLPIVVVVSSSMQHDNPQATFYGWLETNLGYNRTYIDSWGFNNGFSIGDMPVVMGSGSYKVGDIVVYDAGQAAPIIHRIIKLNPDGTYQTKGDNNIGQLPFEKSVSYDQIRGKVIFIIPKIGYIKILLIRVFGGKT